MRFEVSARLLSSALASAALALDERSKIAALSMVRIEATGGTAIVTCDCFDHAITSRVPVTLDIPGTAVTGALALATLIAELKPDTTVTIAGDSGNHTVVASAGRSRWRLSTVPETDLPAFPAFESDSEPASTTLAAEDLRRGLIFTSFAAANDARFYMRGVALHAVGKGLRLAATDGHRLAMYDLPLAATIPTITIPNKTAQIIIRLLRGASGNVTLGISPKLIEITTDTITLASKLIGDPFPAYERVVPGPTGTAATIDRGELTRALRRLEAIYDRGQKRHMRIARVVWAPDADGVHVQHTTSDISDDVLAAETNGAISFAVQVHHLVELLDAFEGERVVLDVKGVGQPILISDPEAPYCRAVQMPCRG